MCKHVELRRIANRGLLKEEEFAAQCHGCKDLFVVRPLVIVVKKPDPVPPAILPVPTQHESD